MENELDQDICIRRFIKSDMPAVLALVAQIGSSEDLTESAGEQFVRELADPNHEGDRFIAALGLSLIHI